MTAEGPPIYHFKSVIPIAGVLVMLQGVAEIARCIVCLRTGVWPARIEDVEEIDVVGEQLAHSEFIDEESRARRRADPCHRRGGASPRSRRRQGRPEVSAPA